ncbi:MerR family transcriptional regulator [Variovorax sp. KBW07]|jgi:DNA-binding transcriptional MerR regulator|uniref:MerR family transcriptional regulator n=1 Tax=unclassified Variovorax TaxID=663243 RepID=UPI000F567DB5|nr:MULTISPECIES: MerR family transcriptional regulator [unclassified Variovorax]RQO59400.1 MerR family transcriptional regulator [Variovorax sp. KBW07]RSZ44296.1 MerR family transcriptional regulator [Variovorax sp. 553]RSZ45047.1 MerR family transcriptional regulator [Variovorax sp. 679]
MKIGELAKRTGLAASRIRFYEKSGLLSTVERRENGYRQYGPEALWMLEIIASAQSAGFSLDEIRSLLPDSQATWQHDALLESLQRKVAEIELLQQRLAHNKAQLIVAIESMKKRPEEMACADRPNWVLNQLRETVAPASHPSSSTDATAVDEAGRGPIASAKRRLSVGFRRP